MNEAKWCEPSTEGFEDIMELLCNEAHIADTTIQAEVALPDSPTLHEVLAGPECEKWHAAILEELATIKEAEMWELMPLTSTIQNIIGCKFILQKKRGASGEVMRFKAWLVMQGYSQCEGVDFSETFAPMVKSALLQLFLAICADHGGELGKWISSLPT